MTGIITSLPPLIEQPPGNSSSNPAGLPGVTYIAAILNLPQTWSALQTFLSGDFQLSGSISGNTLLNATSIASGVLTFPAATDTLVARNTIDTLTNKTLTNPVINGATISGSSIAIHSSGTGNFDLSLLNSENLTAGRSLTLTVNDANRTLNMGGNITTAGALTTSGGFASTFTMTGTTTVTFPTAGTLATLAGSEALTNKTINGLSITSSTGTLTIAAGKTLKADNSLEFSGTDATVQTFPSTSATIARTDAAQTFTGTQLFTGTMGVGTLTPQTKFHLNANTSNVLNNQGLPTASTLMISAADGVGSAVLMVSEAQSNVINLIRYNGTYASPSALAANDQIGDLTFGGWNGTSEASNAAFIAAHAAQAWTATHQGTYMRVSTTPLNTTSFVEMARFQPSGGISIGSSVIATDPGNGYGLFGGGLVINGSGSGAVTINATAAASGTLTLPNGADTLVARTSTDTLTNKTISGSSNTLSNIAPSSLANQAAWTFLFNNTSGSAAPTANTIDGLTLKASPAGADELILWDVAGAAVKKALVSAVAAGASVSSIAGNTGAFTLSHGITNSTNDLQIDIATQRGYLAGLILSTAGASATYGISIGVAVDSTSADFMKLTSAYTKTTSAWALGTAAGSLDTGSIAINTWYHVFLIKRPDTGVVDVLCSLSATAPTMPTNYTLFRRIGSMKTNASSQWILFTQVDNTFIWAVPITDVNAIATTAARVSTTLTVPTGIVLTAKMRAGVVITASASATLIQALVETDAAVAFPNSTFQCTLTNQTETLTMDVLTNTSAQVAVRSSNASGTLSIVTFGWIDTRGRFT